MKHRIASNRYENFVRNIQELKRQLDSIGMRIDKMKIYMSTYNEDYNGYERRYVGYFWDTKKEQ